jgi:hypothetical protein
MPIQTATTGNLEEASRVVIAKVRYTMEYNSPCANTVTKFTLGQGEKQVTVPKVGQMTALDLTDGVDIVNSEDIGMTTTDLTPSEVGLKVILTDKLLRQENESVFTICGKQVGDAMTRKREKDIIALYSGFSNTAGAAGKSMSYANFAGCVALIHKLEAPNPICCVEHPYAVFYLSNDIQKVGSYPMPQGYSAELMKDFFKLNINSIPVFETANIVPDSSDDAVGAIYSKDALALVESLAPRTEKERDASLRAWELVMVSDYGCYELDDGYGVKMTYDAAAPSTAA